jgi:uncharacterized protein affecting Mg2+/Co2+ transport
VRTLGTSNFVLFDDDAAKLLARDDTRFDLPTDEASRMARVLAGLGVVGAGAALSQQDGFDYGALGSVVEENNGQLARLGD